LGGVGREAFLKSLVEPFIIYLVLFFPDFMSPPLPAPLEGAAIPFSLVREAARIVAYNGPSLLLLWYLIFTRRGEPGRRILPRISGGDVQAFFVSLPGLLAIGLGISLVLPFFAGAAGTFTLEAPSSAAGWAVVFLSCLSTGYLEETYFRYYLLSRFAAPGVKFLAVLCSTALFALCHFYEGLWGVLNAFFAGLLLALVYLRYGALHGIAWAHGVYNAIVYLTGI
jgi:membrane protease YdiL (CAAX protease family)